MGIAPGRWLERRVRTDRDNDDRQYQEHYYESQQFLDHILPPFSATIRADKDAQQCRIGHLLCFSINSQSTYITKRY